MEYGQIPGIEKNISRLVQGTMMLSTEELEDSFALLDAVRVWELAREKGRTVPQIALAWVLQQPLDIFPLVGCRTPEEFQVNLQALDIPLTPEELDWLDLLRESP